jgi:hypothetical protein
MRFVIVAAHRQHVGALKAMDEKISHNDPTTSLEQQTVAYRCVCGHVTQLTSESAVCDSCGRKYDFDALRSAMAATAVLYTDATGEAAAQVSPTDVEEDVLIGRRMEHFLILNRLGSGGMGAVYRALDESLQRYVALKVIHNPRPTSHDAGVEGAFQEARAQARVNHPNVAHIYYVGSDADIPFLAMELAGEQTLADRMADGPLPFEEVVHFGLQIASALEHAAAFDIVHGDVKPNNVLLVDDHTVKLSDFGLARRLSQTGAGAPAAGTPEFVSPEVTRGQPADHRSDLYSLGVTLFNMTFGRMPYTRSSHDVAETLRLHRDAAVQFPDPWPAELPHTWRAVLERLLAKNPRDRYQDFQALIEDLRKHEPIALPGASPLLRGLAWLFDTVLLSLPFALIAVLGSAQSAILPLARILLQSSVVFAYCYLQAVWGTTPGKRLFQIRIVDQFGLRPHRVLLGVRAGLQFVWAWASVASMLLTLVGLAPLAMIATFGAGLFILADMAALLFWKGESIHDRLLRTRVVLDAAPRPMT